MGQQNKMKIALFMGTIASASAFAPVAQPKLSMSLNAEDTEAPKAKAAPAPVAAAVKEIPPSEREEYPYVDALGAQAPLGYFDPLGLLYKASEEEYNDLRTKEIVHGRVSMLAFLGYITTYAGVRLPGCEEIPSGWAALQADWPPEVAFISFATLAVMVGLSYDYSDVYDDVPAPEHPGDFRNGTDRGNWNRRADEYKMKKRGIELNNGRAAMMGWLGLVVHESMGNLDAIIPTNWSNVL